MTIRVVTGRRFNPSSTIPLTTEAVLNENVPLVIINGKLQPRLPYTFAPATINAALAAAGALLIGTVTAGKVPIIGGFTLSSSVAGRIDVRYNNVSFHIINVAAGVPLTVNLGDGILFTATGGNIDMVNNTAGAINISGAAYWAEYTP